MEVFDGVVPVLGLLSVGAVVHELLGVAAKRKAAVWGHISVPSWVDGVEDAGVPPS